MKSFFGLKLSKIASLARLVHLLLDETTRNNIGHSQELLFVSLYDFEKVSHLYLVEP